MGNRLQATGYSQKDCDFAVAGARRQSSVIRAGIAACAAMLALAGCGNIEPWVKPYEREALADPIMSFDANPVSTSYTHHVFEAREGARGALGSAGGGCGCN